MVGLKDLIFLDLINDDLLQDFRALLLLTDSIWVDRESILPLPASFGTLTPEDLPCVLVSIPSGMWGTKYEIFLFSGVRGRVQGISGKHASGI